MSPSIAPKPGAPSLLQALFHAAVDDAHEGARAEEMIGVRHFTADLFIWWCESFVHDKQKGSPVPQPIRFMEWEKAEIRRLIVVGDEDGLLLYLTFVLSWPRRHGKSMLAALYTLCRCLWYRDQLCIVQGNSEDQGSQAALKRIAEFIEWSPAFKVSGKKQWTWSWPPNTPDVSQPIVRVSVTDTAIKFSNGSVVLVATFAVASSYGKRISLYWNTELGQAIKDSVYQAGASSTGDSWCGLTIMDSTVGSRDNPVVKAIEAGQLAERTGGADGDPAVGVSYIAYKDLRDFQERMLTPWLSAKWLKSRQTQLAPGEFRRFHLNKPTGAGDPAFDEALIDLAKAHRLSPLLASETTRIRWRILRKKFRGGSARVGLGLDRGLGKIHSDRTVDVVVAVGVDPGLVGQEQPIYDENGEIVDLVEIDPRVVAVLAIHQTPMGAMPLLKKRIRAVSKLYGEPAGMRFESYQAKDLCDWAQDDGYDNVELGTMTDAKKAGMVRTLHELFCTARIAISPEAKGMAALLDCELRRYAEIDAPGGGGRYPKYGGEKGEVALDLNGDGEDEAVRVKDDTVEALMWAIDAALELETEL